MTGTEHEANLAFFAEHARRREEERKATAYRHQADWLRYFGHYDLTEVPRTAEGSSTCRRCRKERTAKVRLTNPGKCAFVEKVILSPCDCCRGCEGRGFHWVNTPIPAGADPFGPAPPGWLPYTKKPCKCQRKRKPKRAGESAADAGGLAAMLGGE